MAIHSAGKYTFSQSFKNNESYDIEVETSPTADHATCVFVDEEFISLGTRLNGSINFSDINLTIDCSGGSPLTPYPKKPFYKR